MIKKLLISGTDRRLIYCAQRLSDNFDIAVINCANDEISGKKSEFDGLVLPINPVPSEHENALAMLKKGGLIFAGRPTDELKIIRPDAEIIDYTLREDFSLLNAIPSAEGAVKIALEELDVTLNGMKILVVGCGRIGTALIEILKGFGADITAAVRNARGGAKARILGAEPCCISNIKTNAELVFNTAPSLIFDRELLKKFSRDTLFIDLASNNGGIDFSAAKELGIKTIHALGIPGKNAPVTAGKIIAETISGIIKEREGDSGGKKI